MNINMKKISLLFISCLFIVINVFSQKMTGEYNWENHKINMVNEEPWRASFIPLSEKKQVFHNQRESDYFKSLNGKWSFAYSEDFDDRPVDFYKTDFDVSGWDIIEVPRSWQMAGYGIPIMLNNGFLVEKNPPFIKPKYTEGRETGSYRTTFTLPGNWNEKEIFINFAGIETAFWFWINGKKVGYSEDSRTNSEFNITDYLSEGENMLAVEVYRLCDGTYLEDQDAWRLSGIYRDVYLIAKPKIHIRDFFIQVDLDENYENAVWKVDIDVRNMSEKAAKGLQISAKILDDDENEIANESIDLGNISSAYIISKKIETKVEKPALWSNEFPNLYYALFELTDKKGNTIELAGTHFGYREIEVKERQVFLNGQSFVFRGVNRVEHDPDHGRYVTNENILKDIELMKRHNINCIRTAHSPADPAMYDLCDQYGIWVIDEANVESHGFGGYGNQIAEDTSWAQAHFERLEAMLQRDKNHPSVVMWSLGNEAGISQTFIDMDNLAHKLDPTRPTHYHFADSSSLSDVLGGVNRCILRDKKFEGPNRYLTIPNLEYVAEYEDDDRPFLLNEYAHASGNALGNLPEYVETFEKYPALVGGCIWDWIDQGMNETNEQGEHYIACGCDYSDFTKTHCYDGVIFPNRTVNSELIEVKGAYQNVFFEIIQKSPIKLQIKNYHRFSDLSEFYLTWELLENGKLVEKGKIEEIKTEPLKTSEISPEIEFDFSDGREYVINVAVCQKKETLWGKKGFKVATGYFALNKWQSENPVKEIKSDLKTDENEDFITLTFDNFEVRFDRATGALIGYKTDNNQFIKRGLLPNFYRAPTTNDSDYKYHERYLAKEWTQAGLPNMVTSLKKMEWDEDGDGNVVVITQINVKSDSIDAGFDCRINYKIYPDGSILVNSAIEAFGDLPENLPRIGMQMAINKGYENFTWYGNGPWASYVDRKAGVQPGIYSGTVDMQWEDNAQPQENGNKSDVRWFSLTNEAGSGIKIIGKQLFDASVSHYEQLEVKEAKRIDQLNKKDYTIVNIDYRNAPIHNLSCCGPYLGPLEQYQLNPGKYEYSFWIIPLK